MCVIEEFSFTGPQPNLSCERSHSIGRALLLWVMLPLSLFWIGAASAQDLPDVAQGLQPYTAYDGGELDKVNLLNGALTVRIPLVSYPQKGSLALSYSIIFNSFSYQDLETCLNSPPNAYPNAGDPQPTGPEGVGGSDTPQQPPSHAGCHGQVEFIPTGIPGALTLGPRLIADQTLSAGGSHMQEVSPNGSLSPQDARFYIVRSDNSQSALAATSSGYHSLTEDGYLFTPSAPPAYSNNNIGVPANQFSGDTTILMTPAPGTITDPRGIVYTSSAITDPDGNQISIPNTFNTYSFGNGLPATDSVGRIIPQTTSANVSQCPVIPSAQYQPLVSASQWVIPGPGGNSVTYLFCFASVNILTHIPVSVNGESMQSDQKAITETMLQSVTLPNQTFWGFVYDSNNPSSIWAATVQSLMTGTGQLMTLIYPTGGSVNYTYNFSTGFCYGQRVTGLNPAGATIVPYETQVLTRSLGRVHTI